MRPDGLLFELLDKHVYDAIEDARWHEEFAKLVSAVTFLVDILEQAQTHILHEGSIVHLIFQEV